MKSLGREQICCVIISYNPTNLLLELVSIIEAQVAKIVIVDNKSDSKGRDIISKISNNSKVSIIWNDGNYGIAKALNQGVMQAIEMRYDWVITLDQDTKPFNNMVDIICNVYDKYEYKNNIGAIGANILSSNASKQYRVSNDSLYSERDYLITSGCLLSLESFVLVGGFREDLFIDNVDLEYCLRLKKIGKVILISSECGMYHAPGAPKSLFFSGIKIVSSNHNSIRRYYMARNHMLLCRSYLFRNPFFIAKTSFFFILSLIQMLLVDDDKISKAISSMRGIVDGVLYSQKKAQYLELP